MKRSLLLLLVVIAVPLVAQTNAVVREVSAGVETEEIAGTDFTQLHVAWRNGPFVARASRGERGGFDDAQFEAEFYPRLGKRAYAYLAAGVSTGGALYPDWRAAAEVFRSFGSGWEASLGARHLAFADEVTIATASLGKYAGNWLLHGRVFQAEDDWAGQMFARRYFGDAGSFLGVRAGTAREDFRSGADVIALDSRELVAEGYWIFPSRVTLRARAGVAEREEESGFTGLALVGYRY